MAPPGRRDWGSHPDSGHPILPGMRTISPHPVIWKRLRAGLARPALVLLILGCVAGGITGCAKKGDPEHPPGSTFPRTYPAW